MVRDQQKRVFVVLDDRHDALLARLSWLDPRSVIVVLVCQPATGERVDDKAADCFFGTALEPLI